MTPPHIRTPEAWLDEVSHPLHPVIRPHALEPWRAKIAVWRAQGLSDAAILRELGDPLEAQSDVVAGWPSQRELAEWCRAPRGPWQVLWLPALLLALLVMFMLWFLSPAGGLPWPNAAPLLLSWAAILGAGGYALRPLLRQPLTRDESSRLYQVALGVPIGMTIALRLTPDMSAGDWLSLVGLTIYTAWLMWLFVWRAKAVGQPAPMPPAMQRLQQAGIRLEDLCEREAK